MLTIDEKQHDLPIAMDYLCEGRPDTCESIEVANYLQIITIPLIHRGYRVEIPFANEGCIFQMGVVCESRDNNDTQDSKFVSHIFIAYIS